LGKGMFWPGGVSHQEADAFLIFDLRSLIAT
jgi:hypothetical protein